MEIKNEIIMKALENSISEILEDVMTGYNSPIKDVLREDEFAEEMKSIARKTLRDIMADADFQEALREGLVDKVIEKVLK